MATELTFSKSKKRDGKLGRKCGETEWKQAASFVLKPAPLPLHVLVNPKLEQFLESSQERKHNS